MKPVREIVSRDVIEDLWGAGYTILPRRRGADPFHIPPEMVPWGRSYQWWHLVHDKIYFERPEGSVSSGWAPVPASRHDGYFMPAGHIGDIEVNGLGLFEKSKFEVNQEKVKNVVAAHKKTDDWVNQYGGSLSGHVKVGDMAASVGCGDEEVNLTLIPKHLTPYIAVILQERDRIMEEEKFTSKEVALKAAIDVIQLRITEESASGQAS